jgi:serine/threonine protein kinase
MPFAPNQQLFEYRIVHLLGQGAFGAVCLAHDTLLNRPVAIKELTLTAQTDAVAFNRFLQEARAAGGLNHPHIVTVHALKVTEAEVYLRCRVGWNRWLGRHWRSRRRSGRQRRS